MCHILSAEALPIRACAHAWCQHLPRGDPASELTRNPMLAKTEAGRLQGTLQPPTPCSATALRCLHTAGKGSTQSQWRRMPEASQPHARRHL